MRLWTSRWASSSGRMPPRSCARACGWPCCSTPSSPWSCAAIKWVTGAGCMLLRCGHTSPDMHSGAVYEHAVESERSRQQHPGPNERQAGQWGVGRVLSQCLTQPAAASPLSCLRVQPL